MKIRGFLRYYLSGILVYGAGILFLTTNNYYSSFLDPATKSILMHIYAVYFIASPILFLIGSAKNHKPALFLSAVKKIVASKFERMELTNDERNAALFMAVKLFFVPLMINFLVLNYRALSGSLNADFALTVESFITIAYPLILTAIFLLDTFFFSFGYLVELDFLKNNVKSVEPTALGWSVALICYPPFNTWFGSFVPWAPSEYADFGSSYITFIVRLGILALLALYLWATLSLGAKCSNLTNRGIVSTGAYGLVRHPAYISKNLAWWIMAIPIMSITVFFSLVAWTFIYYLRAVTEERHLSKDKEYLIYCQKTKSRFVPFIY
ncbi:hypothetical protein HYU11_03380 [Candidatus Woesearchaeota archaeon]|nr:hypothetical protein [Candidatus Woesearchaeota archaeon]